MHSKESEDTNDGESIGEKDNHSMQDIEYSASPQERFIDAYQNGNRSVVRELLQAESGMGMGIGIQINCRERIHFFAFPLPILRTYVTFSSGVQTLACSPPMVLARYLKRL